MVIKKYNPLPVNGQGIDMALFQKIFRAEYPSFVAK